MSKAQNMTDRQVIEWARDHMGKIHSQWFARADEFKKMSAAAAEPSERAKFLRLAKEVERCVEDTRLYFFALHGHCKKKPE